MPQAVSGRVPPKVAERISFVTFLFNCLLGYGTQSDDPARGTNKYQQHNV
jgi:hypothetical protein